MIVLIRDALIPETRILDEDARHFPFLCKGFH